MIERKVYRMVSTYWFAPERLVVVVHVTTGEQLHVDWDDRLGVEENHALAAARLLRAEPEFQAARKDGGFIFGCDPANDGRERV